MDTFDDFLSNSISKDRINLNLDNSTLNHLHSMVNLNSLKSETKKNSILGFLSDMIKPRFIIVKLAFASLLLFAIIGNKENVKHSNLIFQADSSSVQTNSFDTLNSYNNQISDSLYY